MAGWAAPAAPKTLPNVLRRRRTFGGAAGDSQSSQSGHPKVSGNLASKSLVRRIAHFQVLPAAPRDQKTFPRGGPDNHEQKPRSRQGSCCRVGFSKVGFRQAGGLRPQNGLQTNRDSGDTLLEPFSWPRRLATGTNNDQKQVPQVFELSRNLHCKAQLSTTGYLKAVWQDFSFVTIRP